uniref:Translocon-associated protein subunit delta n=1 Tax=Phasianus colchicus TaxID=9054 RepID=A0A669QIE6_PHACC
AAKMAALAVLWGLLAAALRSAAEPCPEPTIVPSYYTTSDAVISSESVFVVEISLACKNGAQVGGDVGRYQVRGSRALVGRQRFWGGGGSIPSLTPPLYFVVAAAVGLLVYYFAFSTKSSIQA